MIARVPKSVEKNLKDLIGEMGITKQKGAMSYAFLRWDEYAREGKESNRQRRESEKRLF